jgi:hypothetical protein
MNITELKDKYRNEAIFIVGTSSSLNKIPLDRLMDSYTFGIHRIGLIYERTPWRPSFYICITKRVEWNKKYKADVLKSVDLGIPSFIGKRIESSIPYSKNVCYIQCRDIRDKEIVEPKEYYWDRIVGDGYVSVYGHTGFGAIQIARYMGFTTFYLIGMDLNYSALKNPQWDTNHFHPKYEVGHLTNSGEAYKMYRENLRMAHEFTARKCKEDGLKIFSSDTNVGLDMYPQINIQEMLNERR